jgi:hypothetical protein
MAGMRSTFLRDAEVEESGAPVNFQPVCSKITATKNTIAWDLTHLPVVHSSHSRLRRQ